MIVRIPQGLSRAERFLRVHARLETFLRKQLNEGPAKPYKELLKAMAKRDPVFRNREAELSLFANLRNALAHDPPEPNSEPIADPREDAIARYEEIVNYVVTPPKALDIAVSIERIFSATFADSVAAIVKQMAENTYTHVPILEDFRIVGVFSESCLVRDLAQSGELVVDDQTRLEHFRPFVALDGSSNETFGFVSKLSSVDEIAEMFSTAFRERQRLGAVFVTETSGHDEPLLGLITAWDLAGYKFGYQRG